MMDIENVLLVTIDSLRADHTSCLDYSRDVDPRLAELGTSGASFQQAVANGPNTPASFPAILTGAHSLTYGPYSICGDGSPFLASELQQVGFQTVGYHSNPHLGQKQNFPTGFETFNDTVEGPDQMATLKNRVEELVPNNSALYRILRRAWHYFSTTSGSSAYARADTISQNAIDWITGHETDEKFFMWLHYMDVHYPFKPPEKAFESLGYVPLSKRRAVSLNGKMQERPDEMTEADVEDLIKLYDAEIRYTDMQIGRVIDSLDQRNLLDNTLVIITADHGEAFGEHGRFGHHAYPYEELIRIPLVIAGPEVASTTITQQVSLLDLPPTVLDLLNIEVPETMEGESFRPALTGESIDERIAMTISASGELFGCRTSVWKYIFRWGDDEEYLFHLAADPEESKNVLDAHPDVADRFRTIITDYRTKIDAGTGSNIEYEAEVKERLADLGYMDK